MQQELTRREGECKKSFYRRMALMRKDKFAGQYRNREDHYKFHFMKRADEGKTKPISKNEPLCEQRIRNRMAAQESRERHRIYVEELERKAKIYDQLVDSQKLVCKHCRQNLACDISETEERSSSISDRDNSTKVRQEPSLESYLSDQVIRIDNEGMNTPFGIFFLFCLVAVVTIFSLHSPTGPQSSRLLNADLPAQPLIKPQGESLRSFAEFIKAHGSQSAEVCMGGERGVSGRKNLRSYTVPEELGWRRVGEYICSAPEEATIAQQLQNADKSEQVRDKQEDMLKRGKDWHRVEVSQCFRNIL